MTRSDTKPAEHVCPPEHLHAGNHTCYNAHKCRCDSCREHTNAEARRRRKLRAYGRWEDFRVPAIGTTRRLQALMAIGWTQTKLGELLGTHQAAVWQLIFDRPGTVERPTRDKISALYDRLWDKKPPWASNYQRSAIEKSVRYAAKNGWPPPLAWDDIDNDGGPATAAREEGVDEILVQNVCNGQPGRLNYLERIEAIRVLNARQLGDGAISAIVRIDKRSVFRIRSRWGIAAAVGPDNVPIAS